MHDFGGGKRVLRGQGWKYVQPGGGRTPGNARGPITRLKQSPKHDGMAAFAAKLGVTRLPSPSKTTRGIWAGDFLL